MSVITELLSKRQVRLVWLLEIAGLQDMYTTGPGVPTLPTYGFPWTNNARQGISMVTPADQELDIMTNVASAGQVAVTIQMTSSNNASQFMSIGRRGSPNMVTLKDTLEQSGALKVVVNEDISNWAAAGQLWIGKECINYSARTVVAPFEFTIANRAWFRSEQQRHVASAIDGWAPRIYDKCVTWQSRKARLLVTTLRHDGSQATGWIEYVSGRIVANPEIAGDGQSIAINIIPHTNALDIEVGGGLLKTGLQQGYHAFDGETGDKFRITTGWGPGEAWKQPITANPAPGQYDIHRFDHEDTYNNSPAAAGTPAALLGNVYTPNDPGAVYTVAIYVGGSRGGAGNGITIAPIPGAGFNNGDFIANVATYLEVESTPLAVPNVEEVVQWPDVAISRMNLSMSPGTHVGPTGQFANIEIDPNADGGAAIFFRQIAGYSTNPQKIIMFPWGPAFDKLHYGISLFSKDDSKSTFFFETDVDFPSQYARTMTLSNNEDAIGASTQGGNVRKKVPIRGVADAYYQRGEKYIHVENDIFSTRRNVQVTWTEWDDAEHKRDFSISGTKLASAVTPGVPGVLLTVTEADRINGVSFGDWPGKDRCVIEEVVAWKESSPEDILLELLFSGEGVGLNDPAYDVLPNGANLTTDEIDKSSFRRFPYPDGLARRLSLSLNDFDQISVRNFIEPILQAIGGSLILKLDQSPDTGGVYRRRLALEPTSSEYSKDSLRGIGNGDWASESRPSLSEDNRIVNVIRLKINYNSEEDRFDHSILVSERDSIGEYGPSQVQEIELRGIVIDALAIADQVTATIPFASHRFASLGSARKQITGTVSWSDAILLNAGAIVLVTAAEVFDYDGIRGVVDKPMRVINITPDPFKQTANITLTWHDAVISGWAQSLEIAAIVSPVEFVLKPNQFTEANHPITGIVQTDLSQFAVGDSIRAIPKGDYANSTAGLTIVSIVGNNVTINAAPAIPMIVGDTLRSDDYTNATTVQKEYTNLAADDGTIAGTVPANEFG